MIYQLCQGYLAISSNVPYGTIEQNSSGKFNDITAGVDGIKELGTTYVWYTGVISHATLTDYSQAGLQIMQG
ncbi:hypothetical protein CS542_01965 [Pedobacter sp. IW39]|nr:hypothetical protein CS542_01965 [Pedobacter sp. IW39]